MSESYTQLPWRRKPSLPVLLGVSDLAQLLGEKRPSLITNWRSRSPSFPPDRSTGTQPRFDAVEVIEWLLHDGPRNRPLPHVGALTWWTTIARAFHARTGPGRPGRQRRTLAALVLLRHTSTRWADLVDTVLGSGPEPSIVARAVQTAIDDPEVATALRATAGDATVQRLLVEPLTLPPDETEHLVDLIDALDRIDADRLPAALDAVLDMERDGRSRPLSTTASPLAVVMGSLGAVAEPAVVFDPACGEGSLLIACIDGRADPSAPGSGIVLVGQELDETATCIAHTRFVVRGHVEHRVAEPGHDSLRDDQFPGLRADLVVVDPPCADDAPPLDLWIDHALRHVTDSGRVVISLPLSSLVDVKAARRRPDRRVRSLVAGLVADRRVAGVLVLPRGQRADVVGPLALLALDATTPSTGGTPVGVIGPSLGTDRGEVVRELLDDVAARLRTGGIRALDGSTDDRVTVAMARSADEVFERLAEFGTRVEAKSRPQRRTTAPHDAMIDPHEIHPAPYAMLARFSFPDSSRRLAEITDRSMVVDLPLSSPGIGRVRVAALLALLDELRDDMQPTAYERLRAAIGMMRDDTDDDTDTDDDGVDDGGW